MTGDFILMAEMKTVSIVPLNGKNYPMCRMALMKDGCLNSLDWNGGMEWWNGLVEWTGMVEWNGGMDWNSGMEGWWVPAQCP